jgi:hypothetical protein
VKDYDRLLCGFKSKEVSIKHKDKILKSGIMTNWICHPFYMELFIETEKGVEKIKLYYPFTQEEYGDDIGIVKRELYMDYRISSFGDVIGIHTLNDISKMTYHKFLNTIVSISEL